MPTSEEVEEKAALLGMDAETLRLAADALQRHGSLRLADQISKREAEWRMQAERMIEHARTLENAK